MTGCGVSCPASDVTWLWLLPVPGITGSGVAFIGVAGPASGLAMGRITGGVSCINRRRFSAVGLHPSPTSSSSPSLSLSAGSLARFREARKGATAYEPEAAAPELVPRTLAEDAAFVSRCRFAGLGPRAPSVSASSLAPSSSAGARRHLAAAGSGRTVFEVEGPALPLRSDRWRFDLRLIPSSIATSEPFSRGRFRDSPSS